jgi:hypothetical protein
MLYSQSHGAQPHMCLSQVPWLKVATSCPCLRRQQHQQEGQRVCCASLAHLRITHCTLPIQRALTSRPSVCACTESHWFLISNLDFEVACRFAAESYLLIPFHSGKETHRRCTLTLLFYPQAVLVACFVSILAEGYQLDGQCLLSTFKLLHPSWSFSILRTRDLSHNSFSWRDLLCMHSSVA